MIMMFNLGVLLLSLNPLMIAYYHIFFREPDKKLDSIYTLFLVNISMTIFTTGLMIS